MENILFFNLAWKNSQFKSDHRVVIVWVFYFCVWYSCVEGKIARCTRTMARGCVYSIHPEQGPVSLTLTHSKQVVGLIKLPFDGNPNKGMGLIAHPGALPAQ